MANLRKGTYFNGRDYISCEIIRVGSQNTRIQLPDGTRPLVPTTSVNMIPSQAVQDLRKRLIPTIPLENFYRSIRKFRGSNVEKFQQLQDLLDNHHGPKNSEFLAELFCRSVMHAEAYENIDEVFYPNRPPRNKNPDKFARDFVELMSQQGQVQTGPHVLHFVDYEIYPFRTTYSCCENGKPASRMGSGGMDLLLASLDQNILLPAIGEIKAATENVGPTFALVQSLMYSAQLVTCNQFKRLRKHYKDYFGAINEGQPQVDVIIFLQKSDNVDEKDLDYALSLAREVGNQIQSHIRKIVFLWCTIDKDKVQYQVAESVRTCARPTS